MLSEDALGKLADVLKIHRALLAQYKNGSTQARLQAWKGLQEQLNELMAALEIPENQWDEKDRKAYQWLRENE